MVWSTVSNAAERSSSVNTAKSNHHDQVRRGYQTKHATLQSLWSGVLDTPIEGLATVSTDWGARQADERRVVRAFLTALTDNEFQTLEAEYRKARDPNVKLWRGTKSWWELDEQRDLVGSWCCKRSERYGGRPVCKALKVKVASLNRIRHLIESQELFEKFIWRQWNHCVAW